MRILFVHQNYPAQFQHLAPALATLGHEVKALAITPKATDTSGVVLFTYKPDRASSKDLHPLAQEFESKVIRGAAVLQAANKLKSDGFSPDLIYVHPGWGEGIFLKDVWSDAKLLCYLEYYYHFNGVDVNFDAEFSDHSLENAARVRVKNANNLLMLEVMDKGLSPTAWQKSQFPTWVQQDIDVLHDGINTNAVKPNNLVTLSSEQSKIELKAGQEIITFCSRNLEPYRGFHIFMRCLPEVLRKRPNARVIIVGGEERGYGPIPAGGKSWRQVFIEEVGGQLDMSRVYFVGIVPYATYLSILQISAVHVYLTYPFVLSWSMLEAMSAGCLIVGSNTPSVQEVIEHGENGLLIDFFDIPKFTETISNALAAPSDYAHLRKNARQTIVEKYDLQTVCLPKQIALLEGMC